MVQNDNSQLAPLTKEFRVIPVLALLYSLTLAIIILYLNSDFYHDDAYITLRYARNFIAGSGIVWNPGEYVQGYTNFLHLILISFISKFDVNLVLASRIVGMTALVSLCGVLLLIRSDCDRSLYYLPLILVMTSTPFLVWSIGGLEGTLFSLLVTSGCLLFIMDLGLGISHWRYALSGICFGLSFLTRPDGIVFIAVSFIWLLLQRNTKKRDIIAFTITIAIILLPYIVWQIWYYGDIVPNTFYAKAGAFSYPRLLSGVRYIVNYAICPPFLPLFFFASFIYLLVTRKWDLKIAYLTLSILAYTIFIVFVGGDHMQAFRFLLPLIPLMSIMITMTLSFFTLQRGRLTINSITIATLLLVGFQLVNGKLNPRREDSASFIGTIVGKYIAKAWPNGSVVALNTAGSTPYYAGQHCYIDMLGLNDSHIAKRRIDKIELYWQRIPGHLKGDGNYVLSRCPDYIIVGPSQGALVWEPWFLSDLEMARNPNFTRDYLLKQILLDYSGRPVTGKGLLFTYYERIKCKSK